MNPYIPLAAGGFVFRRRTPRRYERSSVRLALMPRERRDAFDKQALGHVAAA
jgi:hypothetical protein